MSQLVWLEGRHTVQIAYCAKTEKKYTLQVWRWHIKTLTIWYKLQLCLVWQFWQKGTILTVKARQWSVLGPKEINFVHTQKPFTSVTILGTTFTCCHDILMLMTVYALIFSGEARSAVPAAVTATVIKTSPYQYYWVKSVDYQLRYAASYHTQQNCKNLRCCFNCQMFLNPAISASPPISTIYHV